MLQHRRVLAGCMPKARQARVHHGEPGVSTRLILCVLPRRLPFNPLMPLLNGYEVAAAATATGMLRLAHKRAYDGYVVHSPLGWLDTAEACRHIREFDPNTPLIVYTTERSAAEKRDVMAAGAQAYVAQSDDAHNLPG